MNKNLSKKHNMFNPDFPLNKSIRCPSCMRFLTGCWATGKMVTKYAYYKCYYKYCENKTNIRRDTIEELFLLFLDSFTFADEFKRFYTNYIMMLFLKM